MVMFGGWVYAIDLPFSVGGVKIISDKDVTSPLMPSKRYAVDAFGTKITPHDIELDKNFDVYTTSYDEAERVLCTSQALVLQQEQEPFPSGFRFRG